VVSEAECSRSARVGEGEGCKPGLESRASRGDVAGFMSGTKYLRECSDQWLETVDVTVLHKVIVRLHSMCIELVLI
jgi:hypothetical protein